MSLVMQCDVCKAITPVPGWGGPIGGGLATVHPPEGWIGGDTPYDTHLCPECQEALADLRAIKEAARA